MPATIFQQTILSLALILFSGTGLTATQSQPVPGEECLHQLQDESIDQIGCNVAFSIDDEARTDLAELTAGVLLDAECKVNVSIARKTVFESFLHSTALQAPPQPASCKISTSEDPLLTDFTLAPRIGFRDGHAVSATPGMANIQGLHPLLAKLLLEWVNSSDDIEAAMVDGVNDYIDNGWKTPK